MRGKQTVVVSVSAQFRHLYGCLQSILRSTGTICPRIAQSGHQDVADNFAIDTIYVLATSFKNKNIPDLKPSTSNDQKVVLKTSCDLYSVMIMNSGTADQAMTELFETLTSPEEALAT